MVITYSYFIKNRLLTRSTNNHDIIISRFSVEKQNAQADQFVLGAELVSASKPPPRRGFGGG